MVRELVDSVGPQNAAATVLRIAQPTLSRLLSGTTGSLDYGTYCRLVEAIGGRVDGSGRPHPPVPFETIGGDSGAVAQRLQRWQLLHTGVLSESADLAFRNYEVWLGRELQRLRTMVEAADEEGLLRGLIHDRRYRRLFEDFATRVGRGEVNPADDDKRYWLAIYRTFEPLAAHYGTWGVELGWEELDDARELLTYLRDSLRREAALMSREPDIRRIAQVEAPMTEAEWLADTLGPEENW